ncbi:MAG: thioredoxin domain-containing protein [Pseudomonadota bacterium]
MIKIKPNLLSYYFFIILVFMSLFLQNSIFAGVNEQEKVESLIESKKYALLVNGDWEKRHQENIDKAKSVLRALGFNIFFADSLESLRTVAKEILENLTMNDELLIYTTGHGRLHENIPLLVLKDGVYSFEVLEVFNSFSYKQRTIIMDQCYSGNWAPLFLNKQRTLFISSGSEIESVCCNNFTPYFWSEDVPDLNNDGLINWQERFAFVIEKEQVQSFPRFVPNVGYELNGEDAFSRLVIEVESEADFNSQLDTLKPGQYAIVTFSATWCGPCKDYAPFFDDLSENSKGQFLFLRTHNEEIAQAWNAPAFPTVMIIDWQKNSFITTNRYAVMNDISQLSYPIEDRLEIIKERISTGDLNQRFRNLKMFRGMLDSLPIELQIPFLEVLKDFFKIETECEKNNSINIYMQIIEKVPVDVLIFEAKSLFDDVYNEGDNLRLYSQGARLLKTLAFAKILYELLLNNWDLAIVTINDFMLEHVEFVGVWEKLLEYINSNSYSYPGISSYFNDDEDSIVVLIGNLIDDNMVSENVKYFAQITYSNLFGFVFTPYSLPDTEIDRWLDWLNSDNERLQILSLWAIQKHPKNFDFERGDKIAKELRVKFRSKKYTFYTMQLIFQSYRLRLNNFSNEEQALAARDLRKLMKSRSEFKINACWIYTELIPKLQRDELAKGRRVMEAIIQHTRVPQDEIVFYEKAIEEIDEEFSNRH